MKQTIAVAGISLLASLVFTGCAGFSSDAADSAQAKGATHMRDTTLAGENGETLQGAVENAREWSRKYATLADKCMKLQQENQAVTEENRKLADQIKDLQVKLIETQKELTEANAVLGELNEELGQWKRDVLGFRDEMRRAQQAQLDMLSKMVILLGGELPDLKSDGVSVSATEGK